jgi:3-phenylpropionate/trans-cinnamate dioxygenase ferredoxin reductase subunit
METSTPDSIVILGTGQAGIWAAKTLRDEGYEGRITMVGDETHAPYERPPLSKALLKGTTMPSSTQLFSDATLETLCVEWKRGVRAESIDLAARSIVLPTGRTVDYDKLILCTGGRAVVPAIAGMQLPGVFTLRTLDDCVRMRVALESARRVCIVGGGWIGLEVAATAREMGKSVSVLHKGDRVCERVLPSLASASLLALHQANGVDVYFNVEATGVSQDGASLVVSYNGGSQVHADIVVVAVGLVPNDELASEAGLECARGILVDRQCRTSNEHVFAAGDVAVAPNRWAGQPVRLESWQNATDQAVVAAKVILGKDAYYDPLPWFWSDQFGVNLQIYGWPRQSHQVVTRELGGSQSRILFLLSDNKVESAIAINAPRELRASRRLIEGATEVDAEKLRDPSVRLASI